MLASTEAHYRRQQRLTALTVMGARRTWQRVNFRRLDETWNIRDVALLVTAAQRAAAVDAETYIAEAVDEQGIDGATEGRLSPTGFAGVASDGRPLPTLLEAPTAHVKQRVAQGVGQDAAMRAGMSWLDMIVATQVQDAARVAAGVAMTARPAVTGYTRMLNPPSCSRCAVLAGRVYKVNQGFLRHPRCDCRHVPTAESFLDQRTDPKAYFESLDPAEQNRIFTRDGAEAIRDGADIGQVVNARRGMTAAGTTTEAARGHVRLMPERIYQQAADRTEALRLLKQHRYLV